jgi:hypothetical protein
MKRVHAFYNSNFLSIEFVICLLISALISIWGFKCNGNVIVETYLGNSRNSLYSTMATMFGSLLGFNITALSIVIGYTTDDRMKLVRESASYQQLWDIFTSTIKFLAITTVLSIIGLFFDKESCHNYFIFYIMVFLTMVTCARLARSIWALEQIIKILTKKTN